MPRVGPSLTTAPWSPCATGRTIRASTACARADIRVISDPGEVPTDGPRVLHVFAAGVTEGERVGLAALLRWGEHERAVGVTRIAAETPHPGVAAICLGLAAIRRRGVRVRVLTCSTTALRATRPAEPEAPEPTALRALRRAIAPFEDLALVKVRRPEDQPGLERAAAAAAATLRRSAGDGNVSEPGRAPH